MNRYLKEITGEEFTAKEFRTWSGTVLMTRVLGECGSFESDTEATRKIAAGVKMVAAKLGNKPATCRKYYVHPCVIEAYMQGALPAVPAPAQAEESEAELSAEEKSVLQPITAAGRKVPRRAA